jgi:hypothetical protein
MIALLRAATQQGAARANAQRVLGSVSEAVNSRPVQHGLVEPPSRRVPAATTPCSVSPPIGRAPHSALQATGGLRGVWAEPIAVIRRPTSKGDKELDQLGYVAAGERVARSVLMIATCRVGSSGRSQEIRGPAIADR